MKTVFTSRISHEDAAQRAVQAGYTPVGAAMNNKGEYVIFADNSRQPQQQGQRPSLLNQSFRNTPRSSLVRSGSLRGKI